MPVYSFQRLRSSQVSIRYKYFPELLVDTMGEAALIFKKYAKLLKAAGHLDIKDASRPCDYFWNGEPISLFIRSAYRKFGGLTAWCGNSFKNGPMGRFLYWLQKN